MGVQAAAPFAFIVVWVLASCDDAAPADSPVAANREASRSETEPPPARPADTRYGHRAYGETGEPLAAAGRYRDTGRIVRLRTEAAEAFRAMQEAARKAGVELTPISGFRTRNYQDGLFSRAIRKYGDRQSAARWVAPPGYSEHHTGFAVDIGALERPETDVESTFEETPAFAWLQDNAHRFGFEMSFPRDNPQGVSYEPWHWRFTGLERTP